MIHITPHIYIDSCVLPIDTYSVMSCVNISFPGLAVAIHNFPEGLATFVATLADPSLGVALCIAIALHNIPEGVCVAMPVYYATGKRWKGFLWAFLSGISEPIGECSYIIAS